MSRVEPRTRREVVYHAEGYTFEDNLGVFIEDLKVVLDRVPSSLRGTALISIMGTNSDGVELTVSYIRPESKEERKKRLDALKKARKMGQEAAKKARFEQYKKLKAEFETSE